MSRLSLLLLVDQDPKGLETLTYGFEREGCAVAGTSDPAMAGDLVRTTSPQLGVVAVHDPAGPALQLLRSLRDAADTRSMPIIATGAPSFRHAAKEAGATEFLPVPLYVRDAITVGRLLTAAGSGGGEVAGSLSDYGIFYLVRAMIATGRSGVLVVERANRKGELRFADGQLSSAQVGSLQGYAAYHQLLLWEQAAMELKWKAVVKRGNQFNGTPEELIEDGERFLRDFAAAAKDLGSAQSVFAQEPARIAQIQSSIPAEVGPVIRLFDGTRTLTDVIEDSPFRVFDTVRIAIRLVDMGALTMREAGRTDASGAATATRPALDEWLQKVPVVEPPSPAPATEAAKDATHDQRGGGSRRKTIRHEKLASDEPPRRPAASSPTPSPAAVAAAFSTAPSAGIPAAQPRITSGSMEVKRDDPRVSVKAMAAVSSGPSIVVDMGPSVVVEGMTPEPIVVATAAPAPVPTPPPTTNPQLSAPRTRQMTPPVIVPPPGVTPAPAASRPRSMTPSPIAAPPIAAPDPREAEITPLPTVRAAADPRARKPTPAPTTGSTPLKPAIRTHQATPSPSPIAVGPSVGMSGAPPAAVLPTTPAPVAVSARAPASPAATAVPSGAAPAAASAAGGGGIEIDPALLAEMQAMEAAEAHAAASPAVAAQVAPHPAAPAAAAPAIAVTPPPRVIIAPPVVEPIAISPPVPMVSSHPAPLTASPAPAPAPAPQAAASFVTPAHAASPAPAETTAAGAAAPTSQPSSRPGTGRHRVGTGRHRMTPSGAFNALEADFFAREADLYKDDKVENFDDLDRKTDPELLKRLGKGAGGGAPEAAPEQVAPGEATSRATNVDADAVTVPVPRSQRTSRPTGSDEVDRPVDRAADDLDNEPPVP